MISPAEVLAARILVVDDQAANVLLLQRMLSGAGFLSIETTTDPATVRDLHAANRYDLILLDLLMPGMDGFEVMEKLKETEPDGYLPVLVITAQPGHKLKALQAGAKDFVSKPFELAEVLARVRNMVEVRLLHRQLHSFNEALEQRVRERTADLQESYLETIFAMTRASEHRDEATGAHVQRISFYCRDMAGRLGLDRETVETIYFSSPMHDIGKICVPDHVLLKPGALSPEEWEVMKRHTTMGAEILGIGRSPYLKMGAEIALNHHEKWDGTGYPNGLREEAIPLTARIMGVCDIYDALRSKRPYKPAFDHMTAVDIMLHGDGRTAPEQFDPGLISAFRMNDQSFRDIFEAHSPGPQADSRVAPHFPALANR